MTSRLSEVAAKVGHNKKKRKSACLEGPSNNPAAVVDLTTKSSAEDTPAGSRSAKGKEMAQHVAR